MHGRCACEDCAEGGLAGRGREQDLLVELGEVRADLLDELLGVQHADGGCLDVHQELALKVRFGLVFEDRPLDGEDELPMHREKSKRHGLGKWMDMIPDRRSLWGPLSQRS